MAVHSAYDGKLEHAKFTFACLYYCYAKLIHVMNVYTEYFIRKWLQNNANEKNFSSLPRLPDVKLQLPFVNDLMLL